MTQDDWGFDDKGTAPKANTWDDGVAKPPIVQSGAWNWRLTVIALLAAVTGVFLVQMLTLHIQNLNAFQVGLWFLFPIMAVLLSAFLLEYNTSTMTPRFSRSGQALVALLASLLVFCIGCLGQVSYKQFSYNPNNYIFLIDKSSSMGYFQNFSAGNDDQNERMEAFGEILNLLPDGTQVGLVLFTDEVISQYPISALDGETRLLMLSVLNSYDDGGTNFYYPLQTALAMLENNAALTTHTTHIIFLTDGDSSLNNFAHEVSSAAQKLNAVVSCIKLGSSPVRDDLEQVISTTKGSNVNVADINNLTQTLLVVSDTQSADVIHDSSKHANWISGFIFVLNGLVLGFALSLMLSRAHEFRLQLILSPLMGAAAFILCKFLQIDIDLWIWNTFAFSLYGFVFMRITEPASPIPVSATTSF